MLYCTYKSWKLHGTSGATQRGCGDQGEKKQAWDTPFIGVKSGG